MEEWKNFLTKKVKIILDDLPSPYPKKKEGLLTEINDTHAIIKKEDDSIEALRLTDIRRIEVKED